MLLWRGQQLPVQTTSKLQNALQTLSSIRHMDKTFSPLLNLLSRNGFYKLFLPNFFQCIRSPLKTKNQTNEQKTPTNQPKKNRKKPKPTKSQEPGCLEIRLLCKGLPRVDASILKLLTMETAASLEFKTILQLFETPTAFVSE